MAGNMLAFLKAGAAHHIACAKGHAACASCFDRMDEDQESGKVAKFEGARYWKDAANCHRDLARSHTAHANAHLQFCKELSTASPDRDTGGLPAVDESTERNLPAFGSDTIRAVAGAPDNPWARKTAMPDGVHYTLPTDLRLVTRPGMPAIQLEDDTAELDKLKR